MPQTDFDLTDLVPRRVRLECDDETNFIDLILSATELSEDEGEVRDLVDVFFDQHRETLAQLRDEWLAEV